MIADRPMGMVRIRDRRFPAPIRHIELLSAK
jgi:hypothetical protein